ncbi:hypothetical protein TNCV_4199142 [Trichonephila clavipes]|uniref:Uncharacterized protein n=1 Tax=Trichonephila clavipes TaxID=2585209 RepID=A0A8X6WB31_TRICX|nr:hypothetical protein TNCV_4199142 [Trichonephila clavipes]
MNLANGQQTTGEVLTTQFCWFDSGCEECACWYFWDNPTHKYPFGEELDTSSIAEKMSSNTCQLREGEGGEATIILEHHTYALTPCYSDRVKSLIPLRKCGHPP